MSGTGSDDDGVTHRERDVSGKLAVALGGVASGADEIVIDQDFTTLELENNDPDLFELSGTRVIPLAEGIGYVTPIVNGHRLDPIEVTIPPQKLIQILIGEARGELAGEATTEEGDDSQVKATSVSVTGDAVGAVIRNRINLIDLENSPSLFRASAEEYERNPPVSYYDAVIEATDGTIYQFSPVDPDDLSNEVYVLADRRLDLDGASVRLAYDQAVLTAAAIFSGETEDPTTGAFAFYSPTQAQYEALEMGLASRSSTLPAGCGASDANFPALAPVQAVLLAEVAPDFIFVRSKNISEPAVVSE